MLKLPKFSIFFKEMEASPRQGLISISQLSPKKFIEFLYQLKNNYKGKISSNDITIHEKVDGSRLLFGIDEKDKFFIETSYSGPFKPGTYVDTIRKKFGYEPADFTYKIEEMSLWLDKNKKLKQVLEKYKPIKIIGEIFYNPLGQIADGNKIRFVHIYYDMKKLGKVATYIILNVICSDCDKNKVINDLKSISNPNFKITDNIIKTDINISVNINKFFNELNKKYKDWERILDSRKKADRDLKNLLKEFISNFQLELEDIINSKLKSGKFGDEFEGLVMDFPDKSIKTQTKIFKMRKQQNADKFKHVKR